ncbi:hypothetical protein MMC29_005413 [Sticta canariensis]|nr:hypothetical protein [Sticta canariensis]
MDLRNRRKRKKTIANSPRLKRRSKGKEMLAEVATRAPSENPESAKAAFFSPSNETPTPAEVATSISSDFPTPVNATLVASNDEFTPAEIAPFASDENATPAEVARFGLSRSNTLEEVAPNVSSEDLMLVPTCSEEPHLFSGLDLVDALLSLADAPEATHSEVIRPCERASAHPNKPFHVCLDCRNRATRHIADTTPKLLERKYLPMCTNCGNAAVKWMAERSITHDYRMGCQCAVKWLCWQCKTEAHESASARKDAELDWRRAINVLGNNEVGSTCCNLRVIDCICGKKIAGKPSVYRCVGCEGFMIHPVK